MSKVTILNVDDNEDSLHFKSWLLREAEFDVLEAATGREALRRVRTASPHLVLLDINLPDINGFEVCRQIKADPTTASVLVLHLSAAFIQDGDKVRGLEGGADSFLTAPVEPEVLIATIRSLLRLWQAEEALRESEASFRLLFMNNPHPMWVYDLQALQFLEVNTAAVAHYGYSRQEFLNMRIVDLRPPEDVPALLEAVKRQRPDFQHSEHWRHRLKNGQTIDVAVSSHTLEFAG